MRKLPENVARLAPTKAQSAPGKTPIAVLHDRFGEVAQLVALRNSERVQNALRGATELSGRWEGDRERALARLEKLPGREVLSEQREVLRAAVYDPATDAEARAILGLMLKGIPAAASGATVAYGDALAFSVVHVDDDRDPEAFLKWRGFSGSVLFATVRRIWEKTTFTPSIAEVLEIARKVRAEYYAAFSTTNRLLDLRLNAEDVVDDTTPVESITADACADPEAIPF